MEFIPQLAVAGAIVFPQELAQTGRVSPDRLDRIWKDLRDEGLKYGSFQLTPDESGVAITGSRPGDLVNIQPPLVQIQIPLDDGATVAAAGSRARRIIEIVARAFKVPQILNTGVRVTYRAPLLTNDARELLLHRVLSGGGEHTEALALDGDIWSGVKVVVPHAHGQYTVHLEPLMVDQMKSLHVDVDGQFPDPAAPDSIGTRFSDLEHYVSEHVGKYIERISEINRESS